MPRLPAVLLAVLALAGCGGASVDRNPESTQDWAGSVCTAFSNWRDSVRGVGDELSEGDALTTDSLKDAADQVEEANERLVRQLRSIDAPDEGDVSAAEATVRRLSEDIDDRRGEVEEAFDRAEADPSVATVFDAISIVAAALRDTARDLRDAIEDLADAGSDAAAALQDADACRELVGENGAAEPEGS